MTGLELYRLLLLYRQNNTTFGRSKAGGGNFPFDGDE